MNTGRNRTAALKAAPMPAWFTGVLAVGIFIAVVLACYVGNVALQPAWPGGHASLSWLVVALVVGYVALTAGTQGWLLARLLRQRAVVASEARYRLLFSANPQPMAVYALDDLRFLAVNDAAVGHYGYSREEFLAMTLADIRTPDQVAKLNRAVSSLRHRAPRGVQNTGTWRHRTKDGKDIQVEVRINRLVFEGRPACLVLAHDVTRREAADELLRTYKDELGALTQRLLLQERTSRVQTAQALHDQVGQTLAVARMQLETVARQCREGSLLGSAAIAERSMALIAQAMQAVRSLHCELHPPLLQERGLLAALGGEIDNLQAACPSVHLVLEGSSEPARRWPAEVEYAAYMIAREAAANAMRHAGASQVRVCVDEAEGRLQLRVDDNGRGISAEQTRGRAGHLGIAGMRERARAINASFELSCRPQGGTNLLVIWKAPA